MADFIPSSNLNFDKLWQSSSDIKFGEPSAVNNDVNASISASITVTASGQALSAEPTTGISINASYMLNATASGASGYDANVDRLATYNVSSDAQNSKLIAISKRGSFERNEQLITQSQVNYQQSLLIGTDKQAVFEGNNRLQTSSQPIFESGKGVSTSSKQLAEYQYFIASRERFVFETTKTVSHDLWFGFEAMLKRQTERLLKGEYSELIGKTRSSNLQSSIFAGVKNSALIETAKIPPCYYRAPIATPELEYVKPVVLNFACRWYGAQTGLSFGASCQYQNNPPDYQTGVVFVTNSVSLNRTGDGREIQMYDFSVSIDSNSYTWSFSATVPLSELSKVDTAHEQQVGVNLTCNGNLWRFILDGCDDSVQFGASSLTIKGKSRAMLLASPYAQPRSHKYDTAMSARQIADDELNRGGVLSGFTLDWQLAGINGWDIPANTYRYSGRTPINSLQWIAESAGGFINAHMSDDIIHVLAHYPTPSWEWASQVPTLTLPQSLITSRNRGRINKPSYNGVLVYGEHAGSIGALIKRTGTAGGYQPQMVTSDLITDQAAAISRGKLILSDTGDIGNIALSMPLHQDIGVLKPSTLVKVNDGESWIGMIRGTTITGKLGGNQTLEIDQSVDVERHFDKEVV